MYKPPMLTQAEANTRIGKSHDKLLQRDVAAINARITREFGALPSGGLEVQPKRKPQLPQRTYVAPSNWPPQESASHTEQVSHAAQSIMHTDAESYSHSEQSRPVSAYDAVQPGPSASSIDVAVPAYADSTAQQQAITMPEPQTIAAQHAESTTAYVSPSTHETIANQHSDEVSQQPQTRTYAVPGVPVEPVVEQHYAEQSVAAQPESAVPFYAQQPVQAASEPEQTVPAYMPPRAKKPAVDDEAEFPNEFIREADVEKYGLKEIDDMISTNATYARNWTVDRDRGIYLRNVAIGDAEQPGNNSRMLWTFYWGETPLALRLDLLNEENASDPNSVAHWKLMWVNGKDGLPAHLRARKDDMLQDLKLALVKYKDFGVSFKNSEANVQLEVDSDCVL